MDYDRRSILTAAGAVTAAHVASAGAACAGAATSASGPGSAPSEHHTTTTNRHDALRTAIALCIERGEACLAHCLENLGAGDRSLFACSRAVNDMLAICRAVGPLASADSPLLGQLAALCIESCARCEKECKPHVSHHEECRVCKEACAAVRVEAMKIAT